LPPEDKYTLQTASVIGRVFQQVVLGYLLQRQHAQVPLESTLSELQQRELIRLRSDFEYIFKHTITREVTYNSLLIMRRKELHRATAETIEMLFPNQIDELAPTLAYHYEVAEAREKAAQYFTRAGERAQQTYANLEAAAFYWAAIQQWEQLGDKAKLGAVYENLGMTLSFTGQVDDSIQAYETALSYLEAEDGIRRARLYRREGNAYNVSRRMDDMFVVYERALAALGPRTVESTHEWIDLQLVRIWACYFSTRMPELASIMDEARPAIEEHGTLAQKARWFESLVLVDLRRYRYFQLPDETLNSVRKQVEAAWASGNRRAFGRAQTILGFVHLWRDELAEAERNLINGLRDVEAVGDVDTQFINVNYMALVGRKRGDISGTREWAARTLLLSQKAKNPFYQVTSLGSLAWADMHANDEASARQHLQDAFVLLEKVPMPVWFMVLGPALALEVRQKNWGTAVEYVTRMLHPSQQKMPDEIQSMLEQAVAGWEAGDAEATEAALVTGIELMKQKQLGYV
jgi:tetratricopeptide (TPR) repeat protein